MSYLGRIIGWIICGPHYPVMTYERCSVFTDCPEGWVVPVWTCSHCGSIIDIEWTLAESD